LSSSSSSASSGSGGDGGGGGSGSTSERSSPDPAVADPVADPASDPAADHAPAAPAATAAATTLDRAPVFDGLINAALAHEIALDDQFRLQPPSEEDPASLQGRVRAQLERAFFDGIRRDMAASPPDYSGLLRLMAEVRDGIMAVTLPGQEALRAQIAAYFDEEHAAQRLRDGAFDFAEQQTAIVAKLGQLCAAARDDDVHALSAVREPVAFYKACLDLVRVMRLDLANFYIGTMRRTIRERAVRVEKANFSAGLQAGILRLDNTTAWLRTAAEQVRQGGTFGDCFNLALLQLLDGPPLGEDAWPETLALDRQRLSEMAHEVAVATITAASHTIACGSVPALRELRHFTDEMARVIPVVIGTDEEPRSRAGHVAVQTVALINSSLQAIGRDPLPADQAANIRGQIERLQEEGHPVMALLRRRIRGSLLRILNVDASGTAQEEATLPRNAGLDVVAPQICSIGKRLARLSAHNRAVHADTYDAILARCL